MQAALALPCVGVQNKFKIPILCILCMFSGNLNGVPAFCIQHANIIDNIREGGFCPGNRGSGNQGIPWAGSCKAALPLNGDYLSSAQ